jgi:ferrous iron transport protein A
MTLRICDAAILCEALPLGSLSVGAAARVIEIRGGRELTRKLAGLGVRAGTELRVEHRRGRGLVVAVGATRVALGGGIVDKLIVHSLANPDEAAAEHGEH